MEFAQIRGEPTAREKGIVGAIAFLFCESFEGPPMGRASSYVLFAGEHLSSHWWWMQGAPESGLRVVTDLTTARQAAAA